MTAARRTAWRRAVLTLGVAATGCGPADDATIECRCVETTDLQAFPHCRDAGIQEDHEASSPFSTRIPECPSGRLLFLREPTTPEAVLFNVRDTFEGFSPVQYLDQLTDDFLFVPEVTGLDLYREVYEPPDDYDPDADADTLWTRLDERRFATNWLDPDLYQRLTVSRWYEAGTDEHRSYPDDLRRETYIFPYIVDLTEPPGADGRVRSIEVRGRMEVDLVTPSTENPLWSVRRWQDFRDAATERSFTELRGQYWQ